MNKASWTVIALAIAVSPALAQPADTAPQSPTASPPAQAPPAQVDAQASAGINVDDLIGRARAASPTLERLARGALRRARRAIALGPTVGVWGGLVPGQDQQETAITFGLGLETFKIPVLPELDALTDLVTERAKAKLKEQIVVRYQGNIPDPVSAQQFAQEVWEDEVKEVLALENIKPQTMEPPAMNLALEVNRQFKIDGWTPRLRVGIGVWKVTLGASVGVLLGADGYAKTPVYTGLELVTHFLTSDNPRSSVVDVFLRADFELRNRDTNTDQFVLGLRYLLDVI